MTLTCTLYKYTLIYKQSQIFEKTRLLNMLTLEYIDCSFRCSCVRSLEHNNSQKYIEEGTVGCSCYYTSADKTDRMFCIFH
jgi:hypothetical protein